MESGDEMTTLVPRFSLEERLRAVMQVTLALAAVDLLYLIYQGFKGQALDHSTAVLFDITLGVALGCLLGARMKEYSTALRVGIVLAFAVAGALLSSMVL